MRVICRRVILSSHTIVYGSKLRESLPSTSLSVHYKSPRTHHGVLWALSEFLEVTLVFAIASVTCCPDKLRDASGRRKRARVIRGFAMVEYCVMAALAALATEVVRSQHQRIPAWEPAGNGKRERLVGLPTFQIARCQVATKSAPSNRDSLGSVGTVECRVGAYTPVYGTYWASSRCSAQQRRRLAHLLQLSRDTRHDTGSGRDNAATPRLRNRDRSVAQHSRKYKEASVNGSHLLLGLAIEK